METYAFWDKQAELLRRYPLDPPEPTRPSCEPAARRTGGLSVVSGAWTPDICGEDAPGRFRCHASGGYYSKAGETVTVNFHLRVSAVVSPPAGRLLLGELPFRPVMHWNGTLDVPVLLCGGDPGITSAFLRLFDGGARCALMGVRGGVPAAVASETVGAGFLIGGSFSYQTDDLMDSPMESPTDRRREQEGSV